MPKRINARGDSRHRGVFGHARGQHPHIAQSPGKYNPSEVRLTQTSDGSVRFRQAYTELNAQFPVIYHSYQLSGVSGDYSDATPDATFRNGKCVPKRGNLSQNAPLEVGAYFTVSVPSRLINVAIREVKLPPLYCVRINFGQHTPFSFLLDVGET